MPRIRISGVVGWNGGEGQGGPIANAHVGLYRGGDAAIPAVRSDVDGNFELRGEVADGEYIVGCAAFGLDGGRPFVVSAQNREHRGFELRLDLQLRLEFYHSFIDGRAARADDAHVERTLVARCESNVDRSVERAIHRYVWDATPDTQIVKLDEAGRDVRIKFEQPGRHVINATINDSESGAKARVSRTHQVGERARTPVDVAGHVNIGGGVDVDGRLKITMERTESRHTPDRALWEAIRERSSAIGFEHYRKYIGRVLKIDRDDLQFGGLARRLGELGARGVGVYQTLRDFTELFVLSECGWTSDREFDSQDIERELRPDRRRSDEVARGLDKYMDPHDRIPRDDRVLPYYERIIGAAEPWIDPKRPDVDALRSRVFRRPLFLELWHEMCLEHGTLMRTMDAISARFQNVYNSGENDGLANYESSPLRPLSDFFWGWIERESTRLNARRRIQEYKHQYGPSALDGTVSGIQAADVRTAFPDAFMNLMSLCESFYWEDSQTTVIADAFPVLFGLRQVHQILAMGAGNTAPQLTFAARVETLMMQLMLAQPELRAFLRIREMVPYEEDWQASVDAMIDLQGWKQPLISQHNDCAKFGERILLSIRLADWTSGTEDHARNWLREHREAIHRFLYAQRAISSADPFSASVWSAPRLASAPDSRAAIPGRQQRAYAELAFGAQPGQRLAQNPGEYAPRLPARGWPVG
jgi:hypothetical protein